MMQKTEPVNTPSTSHGPRHRRRRALLVRCERGQSMVEMALILPIMLILLIGLFDVGYAVVAHNFVANTSREVARLGITKPSPTELASYASANDRLCYFARVRMRDLIGSSVSLPAQTATQCGAITGDPLTVTASQPTALFSGGNVQISVTYQYQLVTPFIPAGPVTMTASSSMRVEF